MIRFLQALRFYFLLTLILATFISLSLVLSGGDFYEGGVYLYYTKSILQDLDLNIINQVPKAMGWLVTKSYFHPDFHTEVQTPLMAFLHIFEEIADNLFFRSERFGRTLEFSSMALSVLSLWIGMHIVKKIANLLEIKFSAVDFFLFYFGSVIFYFSIHTSTVVEISAFPLFSYAFYQFFKIKKGTIDSAVPFALCLGLLAIMKSIYLPFSIYMAAAAIFHFYKKKNYKEAFYFIGAIALILACNSVNHYLKFGQLFEPRSAIIILFDYSLSHALLKIKHGLFEGQGLFFNNPTYPLAMLGAWLLTKELAAKKMLSHLDIVFFAGWIFFIFFHTLFIGGDFFEDHLPGRTCLAALPVMLLGYGHLRRKWTEVHPAVNLLFGFICLWHLFFNYSFVLIDGYNSYLYANTFLPTGELFVRSLVIFKNNLQNHWYEFSMKAWYILLFSAIISAFFVLIKNRFEWRKLFNLVILSWAAGIVLMTLLNVVYSGKNIENLKHAGHFQNVVVGDGAEIFYTDYFFDLVKTIRSRNNPDFNRKVDAGVSNFYRIIAPQVLMSTPEFDQVMRDKSEDFTFWMRTREQ